MMRTGGRLVTNTDAPILRRSNPLLWPINYMHVFGPVLFVAWSSCFRMSWLTIGLVAVGLVVGKLLLARGFDWFSRTRARIEKDADGLVLVDSDGIREPLTSVETATECSQPRPELWLERVGKRALRIEIPKGLTRVDIIDRLNLGTLERCSRYRLGSPIAGFAFILAVSYLGLSAFLPPGNGRYLSIFWNLCILLPSLLLCAAPLRADLGADGIALRWLFISRYIGFAKVSDLRFFPPDRHESQQTIVRIDTKSGKSYRLNAPGGKGWVADVGERFRAYQRRVLHAEGTVDAAKHPVWFRYAEESLSAWVDRLRSPLAQGAYRSLPEDADAVLRLASDPDADMLERSGAFIVASRTTTGLEAVRAQVNAIAHPTLRALAVSISDKASTETIAGQMDALIGTDRG
jgi:hypothetical protein